MKKTFNPDKIPDKYLSPVLTHSAGAYRVYAPGIGVVGPLWGCARGILQHFEFPEGPSYKPRCIQFAACPPGELTGGNFLFADAMRGPCNVSGLLLEPVGSDYRTDDGRLLSLWVGDVNAGDPLWEWVRACNQKGWCRFVLLYWGAEVTS